MSLSTITAITPLQLQRTNQRYASKFPHWTMPLRKTPVFSFRQMAFDTEILATGYVQSRRPSVRDSATALAQLLTYEAVENLIATKAITASLAREWGAILQYAKLEVPFNLIAFGLGGEDEDPADYPVPKTDRLVLQGLLLPTEDAVLHFKLWYEDGRPDLNFEHDLIMPLLTYWSWYRGEHPHIRGIDFGMGSISAGVAAGLETPFGRKYPEPGFGCYDDYPWMDINEIAEVEEDEETSSDGTPSPVVGVSPSGAKIY
jgi:hypothetical protein